MAPRSQGSRGSQACAEAWGLGCHRPWCRSLLTSASCLRSGWGRTDAVNRFSRPQIKPTEISGPFLLSTGKRHQEVVSPRARRRPPMESVQAEAEAWGGASVCPAPQSAVLCSAGELAGGLASPPSSEQPRSPVFLRVWTVLGSASHTPSDAGMRGVGGGILLSHSCLQSSATSGTE